jgi:hypothetical protein
MIELSVALVFVAIIARDCFRFWVKSLEYNVTELRTAQQSNADAQAELVKKLAEDWARKFRELEAGNEQMRKHIDSQVAGTIAQLPATGRGFGR